jgi:hypothetical protein
MQLGQLILYAREVDLQCQFVQQAYEDMTEAQDARRKFLYAHALVAAAGNVSKLLWPPDRRAWTSGRGTALRQGFGVTDANPLANRKLRDHLEHFDERLDQWLAEHGETFVDLNVAPPGAIQIEGLEPGAVLRQLDPATWTYSFRGEEFSLPEIVQAATDLRNRALAVARGEKGSTAAPRASC